VEPVDWNRVVNGWFFVMKKRRKDLYIMDKSSNGITNGFQELGTGKMMVLGLQHVFAMFGATVLVPILTGLSVSVTLFCAGIGTLLFHLITKNKVPIFLGSSFAFLAAFGTVAPMLTDVNGGAIPNSEMLPYALGGVVCAGGVYVLLAILIKIFGIKRIMKLFPPVVTGPIIILIGLILAPTGLDMASQNWPLAIITIAILIVCNIWGKGMVKIVPILIAIFGAYAIAAIVTACGVPWVDFSSLVNTNIVAVPEFTLPKFEVGAIVTFVVVALAAMIEHIGDIAAIGATCGKNYIANPGLTRTLLGDGLATSLAGFIGGPANTTYSENTGVVALTNVYDPNVMMIAAVMTVILSFVSAFSDLISTIPTAIIGGVSFILYGMISAVGLRNVTEHKVDFSKSRNVLVAALIFVCGLGFNAVPLTFTIGGTTLSFGGLAVASVVGIVVNAVLPGKDYDFKTEEEELSAEKIGAK
jgi:uracil permease